MSAGKTLGVWGTDSSEHHYRWTTFVQIFPVNQQAWLRNMEHHKEGTTYNLVNEVKHCGLVFFIVYLWELFCTWSQSIYGFGMYRNSTRLEIGI